MRTATFLLALLLSGTAFSAVYYVDQANPVASDDNPGSAAQPWKTISKAAATLVAGDRVVIGAGIYREYVEPRNSGEPGAPITYEAAPGAKVVLTGADVIKGWKRVAGDKPIYRVPWTARFIIDTVNGKPIYHHPDDAADVRMGRAEQMVVDGHAWDYPQIELSVADMKPGTFFPDVDHDWLYLWLPYGSNPAGHTIEACTRGMIFGCNPWARPKGFNYVTVRGLTFRYCATFPQRAAVWLLGEGNVAEDCTVEWMSGSGISVGPEDGVMRNCVVRDCGHTGGCANGHNFLNEDCLWEDNCRKPINRGWDAGGVKIAESRDGVFQRCIFRHNGGPGLWFDIDVTNVVVRNCLFDDNEGSGLFIEISRDIDVVDNDFFRNGLRATGATWATAGLTLAESRSCVVANNLLVGNLDGIDLREQGPREMNTPDLGRIGYENRGHVIAGNVSALNKQYQLGLWYDTAWFGRHPADMAKYKTEAAFEAAIKKNSPERWFDPLKQGLVIDRNLYWPGKGGKLALYGVTWRPRHKEFSNLADLAKATGFEAHGVVEDPGLEKLKSGLWRLKRDGAAFKGFFGPRLSVAGD